MRIRMHWRALGAASLVVSGALGLAGPAAAGTAGAEAPEGEWATVADLGLPEPTASEQQKSVLTYEHHPAVRYTYERAVTSIETIETEGTDTVISLATDILFAPDEWDLPDSAPGRLESLLSEVPEGASVAVHGHTDSVVGAVENQELSENRAEAVAGAIEQVRPDLALEVAGFGASELKESESGSDADAARRANRRVELRYQD